MGKHRLAILFSGGGTTAEAMVKAVQAGKIPNLEIICAIASTPEARGIEKLKQLNIPIFIINPNDYKTKEGKRDSEAFGTTILETLVKHRVTVVTQNGWIPLTPENVVKHFTGNIYNQHPGPLPEFGGKGMMGKVVHDAFLRFRKKVKRPINTQVIAHRVAIGLDEGVVVKRTIVKVVESDTPETLQERALPLEHLTQIALLKDIANNSVEELLSLPVVQESEKQFLSEAKKEAIG